MRAALEVAAAVAEAVAGDAEAGTEDVDAEVESDAAEEGAALWLDAEATLVDAGDALALDADDALAEGAAESVLAGAAVADAVVGDTALLAEPLPEGMEVSVHAFSSLTSGVPFVSVIGVMVMVHVSCIGPEDLD